MIADRACQHATLDVAALADEILGRVAMADALDVLVDDRSLVEIAGDVMRRGADQLDAALMGLVVGLGALETGLRQAISLLKPGGRLVVIAYHSLEDRIVKNLFRQEASKCICPPERPICDCGHTSSLRLVSRRVIKPSQAEIEGNPRSRSARLRAAERL